jgi:hypothetical protein
LLKKAAKKPAKKATKKAAKKPAAKKAAPKKAAAPRKLSTPKPRINVVPAAAAVVGGMVGSSLSSAFGYGADPRGQSEEE